MHPEVSARDLLCTVSFRVIVAAVDFTMTVTQCSMAGRTPNTLLGDTEVNICMQAWHGASGNAASLCPPPVV